MTTQDNKTTPADQALAARPSADLGTLPLSRRTFLRGTAFAGGAMLLGPTLAACGGSDAGQAVTLGLNRSLVSLDNKVNQFDAAVTVQRAVRQALTKIGDKLTPEPVLAEKFVQTKPTEWTVTLRKEAVYSDGTPVTIDDVSTALKMYSQVKDTSFVGQQFSEWPVVTKVDDRTFTLTTTKPIVTLDSLMSNILITPAAKNVPQELDDGVGSGPYKVTKSDRGTGNYTLEANDKYWGADKPKIKTVNIRFMPEEASRVIALRSGEVDVIDTITPDSASQLASVKDVVIESRTGTRFNHFFFNFRKDKSSPLANPNVRKALSFAVNGDQIASSIMSKSVTPAEGVCPQTLAGWVATGKYAYDPERAKQMLAAENVSNLSLKLIWESGEFAGDNATMEAMVEMMKAIGVKVELQQFQPGGNINAWRRGEAGDWDILGNGYGNQTGLAMTTLQGMYGGTAEKEKTHDSYHGFVFPEISDRLTQAGAEPDEAKRNTLLGDAQKLIWDQSPCLWAFIPNALLARRVRVEGISLRAVNSYDLSALTLKA